MNYTMQRYLHSAILYIDERESVMTFVLVYLGACAVSAPAIIGLFAGSKAQRIECKSWLRAGKGE